MDLDALRTQIAKDRAAGNPRPLREYLERFPGDDVSVAREVVAAAEEAATGRECVGPYRIVRELGRGGQAIVYLAEDTRIARQVALKVLPPVTAEVGNDAVLKRFRREAEVSSRLDHPGICDILEADVVRGTPYIAMRFVPGETLARRIATAREAKAATPPRAQLDELAALFEKVARALHAAHEAGVIHRDIKPANLMVTPEGEPVVLDFGLARHDDAATQTLSLTGDASGTPAYMSPEQMTGRARPDRRTDVWSLGVALYESATLEHPFAAATRESLFQAIISEDAPDPRRFNHAIDRDLATILDTAMAKERDRRYQTGLDLAEDLRLWRTREPIRARPVGRFERVRRWAARNPALAGSLAAAGALFAIASALLSYGIGASGRAAAQAQLRLLADEQRTKAERDRERMEQDDRDQRLHEDLGEANVRLGTLIFGLRMKQTDVGILAKDFLAGLSAFGLDLADPAYDEKRALAELRAFGQRRPAVWSEVQDGFRNLAFVLSKNPDPALAALQPRALALVAALPESTWPEVDTAQKVWAETQEDTFGPLLNERRLKTRTAAQLVHLASALIAIESRREKALEVMERAILLDPGSFLLHFMRAGCGFTYWEGLPPGDAKDAQLGPIEHHLAVAVALRPRSGFVRSMYGAVLALQQRYREAAAQVDVSTQLEPGSALVWLLKARFYSYSPMKAPAIEACRKALEIDPGLVPAKQLMKELEGK